MLNKRFRLYLFGLLLGSLSPLLSAQEQRFNFDQTPVGGLPSGWVIAATNPKGPLAEWQVKADPVAVSAPQVLTITRTQDNSDSVYNLCWTPQVSFLDGAIEVNVRADSGVSDQGGGLIWRAQDTHNYYIARFNPLENDLRLYFVKAGIRSQLAAATITGIKPGEWFHLKITHQGEAIAAYVNGKQYLEKTDQTFLRAGGVGLWSKTDAASSFDDLLVSTSGLGGNQDQECLFNWAEKNYPALFAPAGAATQFYDPYAYRYYKNTHVYVGVSAKDQHVYTLMPNGVLPEDAGDLSAWLIKAGCKQ